jgi:phage-related protein
MNNEVEIRVTSKDDTSRGFTGVLSRVRSLATSVVSNLAQAGAQAGTSLASGLGTSISSLGTVVGPVVGTVGAVIGAALGAAIAAAAGAAITGGILLAVGGGALVAGIIAASKSPGVQSAWGKFTESAKKAFSDFGKPFEGPVTRAINLFSSEIGKLKPAFDEIAKLTAPLIDKLAPAVTTAFKNILPGVKPALEASRPLFDTLAKHLPRIGTAISQFLTKISGGGDGAVAIFDQLLTLVERLLPIIGSGLAGLSNLWAKFTEGAQQLKAFFTSTNEGRSTLENFRSAASGLSQSLSSAFNTIREAVAPVLEEIQDKVLNRLVPAISEFYAALQPIVSFLIEKLAPAVAETFRNILGVISGFIDIITGIFQVLTGVLTGDWSKAWEGVKSIARGAVRVVTSIIRQIVNSVRTVFGAIVGILGGIMRGAVNAVVAVARGLGRLVSSAIRGGIGLARSAASALRNGVTGVFSGIASRFSSVGRSIVSGIVSGIRGAVGWLRDVAASVARGALSAAKGALGIRSPSTVFRDEVGHQIAAGLAEGIKGGVPLVQTSVTSMAQKALAVATSAANGRGAPLPDVASQILRHYRSSRILHEDLSIPGNESTGFRAARNGLLNQFYATNPGYNFSGGYGNDPKLISFLENATRGGTTQVVVSPTSGMDRGLARAIVEALRFEVRTQGGGNVQALLGRA